MAFALAERMDAMMRLLLRGVRFEESRGAMALLGRLRDFGPSRITDLADQERVTQPSMTVLVARLERTGMVERNRDPQDKRVAIISITPTGRALQQRVSQARADILQERMGGLDANELAALDTALPIIDRLLEPRPDPTE